MNTNNWQSELDRVLNKWEGNLVVTSPDVDGLISAAILKSAFNAEICGIYSTRYLFILDGYDRENCKQALWVGHDSRLLKQRNKANFDSFMVEKKIFSHAFVSSKQLRYTTDLF